MTIKEAYTDMAGKYRVVVEIDNTRCIPLKYEQTIADAIAFADAQKLLDREAVQAELDSWNPINFDL